METPDVKILVVDDRPDNLRAISQLLRDRGYKVQIAINGKLALNAAEASPPDLILLDIMMPQMDGYEVCKALKSREKTKNIPVIFLSALHEAIEKVKGFEVGGVDYITKPFNVLELIARIENQIALQRLQKQLQERNTQLQAEINARTEAETALRLSEEKFAKAFRSSPVGLVIFRLADRRLLEVNDSFCRLTGYSAEELIDRTLLDLNLWVNLDDCNQLIQILSSDREIYNYELQFNTQSGNIKIGLISAEVIENGGEKWSVITINDITQRKRLQLQVLQQERFLESIIEHIPLALFVKDVTDDFRFVLWNKTCEEIFGNTRADAIGHNDRDLYPKEQAEFFHRKDLEVIERGEILEIPEETIDSFSRGKIFLRTVKLPIFDDTGKATHLLGISEDITARKQSEERLRLLERAIAASSNGIVISDAKLPDNPISFVNPGFERMTGYCAREVINKNCRFLQGNDKNQPEIAAIRKALKEETECRVTLRNYRKDGTLFWNELSISPVRDAQNVLTHFIGVQTDITDRQRAEEELAKSQALLAGVLDSSLDAIMVFSAVRNERGEIVDFKWLLLNAAAEKSVGRTAEDLVGKFLLEEMPGNREDRLFDTYVSVVETGTLQEREFYYEHEGIEAWFQNISVKFGDGFAVTFRDITERKQTELALRESEQRFRAIFNNAFQFTGLLTPEGIVIEANQTALDFGGFTHNDIAGRPFWEAPLWSISPETQTQLKEAIATAASGLFVRYEVDVLRADNRVATIDFSLTPIFDDTTAEVILLIPEGRDITERKRAEQELREQEAAIRELYEVASTPYLDFEQRLGRLLAMGRRHFNLDLGILGRIKADTYQVMSAQVPLNCNLDINPGDSFDLLPIFDGNNALDSDGINLEITHSSGSEPTQLIQQIKTYLTASVKVNGREYAVICFFGLEKKQPFKIGDRELLNLMAQWIGHEIERSRSKAALEHQIQRRLLLERITAEIRGSLDAMQIFHTAATQIGQAFRVHRCLIHGYIDQPIPQIPIVAEYRESSYSSALGVEIPIRGNPHAELILARDRAIATPDVYTDPLFEPILSLCRQLNIKSMLAVRTSYQGKPNGAIVLIHCDSCLDNPSSDRLDRSRNWRKEEIELLESVAAQVGIALAQAHLLEHEKQQSHELIQKNLALETATKQAEASNRTKSEFLSKMSHELRTPLNAILGFTQLMSRDPNLSAQQQEYLKIINRSGEHLLDLIDDILSMSKIEAGCIELSENSFDLHSSLDTLKDMLEFKALSKGLELLFELHPGLPQYIKTDEGKLRQILINLMGNAIKFTEWGSVTLRVGVGNDRLLKASSLETAIANQRLTLTFEISDTGPGIAPEEMDTLFEAFVQTETGRKSMQGTGLGLPISQQFVRMMGGEITVSSTVGQGTIFQFDIQATLATASDRQIAPSTRRVIGLEPGQPSYRILVVEDVAENRQLLVKLLEPLGFEVREAVDGERGVALCVTWKPHLILMDMRMPVMDGYEATRQIKRSPSDRNPVIIALTASAFEEQREAIFQAGCDDFVAKPVREEILFEKIAHRLGVRLLYEGEDPTPASHAPASPTSLTLQDLKVMPPEWIQELHHAALCVDDARILELIEQIPASSASLAQTLTHFVENFRVDIILDLTKEAIA